MATKRKRGIFHRIFVGVNRQYTHFTQYFCRQVVKRREPSSNTPYKGETEWQKRWSGLCGKPNMNYFRYFAPKVSNPMDIIPGEAVQTIVEPILNPSATRTYYLDKNMFDRIYGKDLMPKTVLRRINGVYFDTDYNSLGQNCAQISEISAETVSLIAKPTRDSYGGRSILLFSRDKNGRWIWNEESQELTPQLLNELLGKDWILQEKLIQHPFFAQFNESSVNTLRVHVYRSPVTGEVDIPSICMRIGAKGHWYDNLHSGGVYVGIDPESGKLLGTPVDKNGIEFPVYNDIDFSSQEYIVPKFDQLKEFAKKLSNKTPHHHSLACDISIDKDGNFRLIEINIGTFDAEMYMMHGQLPYGRHSQEILDYCLKHKDEIQMVHTIPW